MKAYCTAVAVALMAASALAAAPGQARLGMDPLTGSPMVTTTGANLVVPYRVMVGTAPLAQVELLVSTDLGKSWQVAAASPRPAGRPPPPPLEFSP